MASAYGRLCAKRCVCIVGHDMVFSLLRGQRSHLECERLIKDGAESFAVHLRLELLLLVGQQVDLHVRIGGATHVQGGQVLRLMHSHR